MIKLFLVRHGETDWNVKQRFQGQSDVPLNATGRAQAMAIAQRLSGEQIDAIYASDLSRAWDTAAAIAKTRALKIRPEPNLREGNFGEWEGATYDEIQTRDPEAVKAWHEDLSTFAPPGGETINQLTARVKKTYQQITTEHEDQTVLLAAHGGSLQMLIANLLGLPPKAFWQFNLDHCSLSRISVYDTGAIINLLNDTNHIPK